MLDRSLFSRALHWQLQRALPKRICPNGEKTAQHAVPISLRTDHAMGPCSSGAVGGFRAVFPRVTGQCWMQHTHPSPSDPTVSSYLRQISSWGHEFGSQIANELKEKDFPNVLLLWVYALHLPPHPLKQEICPASCPLTFLDTPGLVNYFAFISISFRLLIHFQKVYFFISEKGSVFYSWLHYVPYRSGSAIELPSTTLKEATSPNRAALWFSRYISVKELEQNQDSSPIK